MYWRGCRPSQRCASDTNPLYLGVPRGTKQFQVWVNGQMHVTLGVLDMKEVLEAAGHPPLIAQRLSGQPRGTQPPGGNESTLKQLLAAAAENRSHFISQQFA